MLWVVAMLVLGFVCGMQCGWWLKCRITVRKYERLLEETEDWMDRRGIRRP